MAQKRNYLKKLAQNCIKLFYRDQTTTDPGVNTTTKWSSRHSRRHFVVPSNYGSFRKVIPLCSLADTKLVTTYLLVTSSLLSQMCKRDIFLRAEMSNHTHNSNFFRFLGKMAPTHVWSTKVKKKARMTLTSPLETRDQDSRGQHFRTLGNSGSDKM